MFWAAVILVLLCCQRGLCKDFNSTYRECVESDEEHVAAAVQKYKQCLLAPMDLKSIPACKSTDYSKCIIQLADDTMFQKCIGSTNLKTLGVVGEILSTQYEFMCSSAGINASQKFEQNGGPKCQMDHLIETMLCYQQAKYPIAGRSTDIETLAGFAFDKEYCRVLQQFDKCEMETVADCLPDVKDFIHVNHDLLWKATPCPSLFNSASGLSSSMLTATIALLFCGGTLMRHSVS